MGGFIIGIVLILVGISALTGISLFNFFVAIVLIAIGVRIIVGHSMGGPDWRWHDHAHWHGSGHNTVSDDDRIDEVAVFSPLDKAFVSQRFKGGKVVMVFSGGDIDLTGVKPEGSQVDLEVSSVFSGLDITIPKDWKVRSGAAVFLGNIDTHQAPDGDGDVTLTIHGEAVFGNIKVRK